MSSIKRKKGISEIIAILVLVSLIMGSASFLIFYLKDLININLSPELCLGEPRINIEKSCYNQETNTTEITLTRRINTNITKIEFILEFKNNSYFFNCDGSCKKCKVLTHGKKTYFIPFEDFPKKVIIKTDNCLEGTKNIELC
jgi:hypothetical protein